MLEKHVMSFFAAIFRHACGLGLEGIVSKRIGSRYERSVFLPLAIRFNTNSPCQLCWRIFLAGSIGNNRGCSFKARGK